MPKIRLDAYWRQLKELRDVRLLGLVLFGGVILMVTWSGIGVIQTNYELQKQISSLHQSVTLKELENENLRLRNQYYETDEYLELQARRQFNRAAPGEKLYIVPKNVALAHSVEPVVPVPDTITEEAPKPFYQQNFEAWMDFLFRQEN